MPNFGYITIIFAAIVTVVTIVLYAAGLKNKNRAFLEAGKGGSIVSFILMTISIGILLYLLVSRNFQVEYVADYTSRDLPLFYTITALWAGMDGSLLFWEWITLLFITIMVVRSRFKDTLDSALVPLVMNIISVFFLVIIIFRTNPFRLAPIFPADGRGMNPLLQNVGMVFHPPFTYLGYIGYAVPFAYLISALIRRDSSGAWLENSRAWSMASWVFLGIGILLGAQWAYVELGWGGYWAWDPVENASLLPWLTGTALLHSSLIQIRRGSFKLWNVFLGSLTFLLVIFGTFLTRSGMISSVHAFPDTGLGVIFIVLMALILLAVIWLVVLNFKELSSKRLINSYFSKEGTFFLNNLILVGVTVIVLLGTLYPLYGRGEVGETPSLSQHFYNLTAGPLAFILTAVLGLCQLIRWGRGGFGDIARKLILPIAVFVVVFTLLFIFGMKPLYAPFAFGVLSFTVMTSIVEFYFIFRREGRSRSGDRYNFMRILLQNHRKIGAYIVHTGVILVLMGVLGSSIYKKEATASLEPGQSVGIGRYELKYEVLNDFGTQNNRYVVDAHLSVMKGERRVATLVPSMVFYPTWEEPISEVVTKSTAAEDIYVILASFEETGLATFKVYLNPLVIYIWIGGYLIIMGALVTLLPKAEREKITPEVRRAG
ncbi:MAG: heme lyase CcmF/NrfE family subunit [Actinobacteria bacterium]|nr:heme lyase CcmF/NrfE family subunit [Actinomycetota bacterium]